MKRKLMKMGPSTLVVSLPAEFVKKHRLSGKDEIEVQEIGDHLQLGSTPKSLDQKAVIDMAKYDILLLRALGTLYKTGYSEFRIKFDEGKKQFRGHEYSELTLIKRSLDSFAGVATVDVKTGKGGNYVIAERKANLIPQEFDRTLNQAFLHLKMLSTEVLEAIKAREFDKTEKFTLIDNLINETTDICIRILSEFGYKEYHKTIFVYSIVQNLEQVGDCFRDIYYDYATKRPRDIKAVLAVFEHVNELVDQFYHTFLNFKIERLNRCAFICQEVFDDVYALSCKKSACDTRMLLLLYQINAKLWDSLEPLMAMNHELLLEEMK